MKQPQQVTGHPYQAVAASIAAKIDAGELKPGEKLPSVRALARDRGVSPMTAQKALTQLAEDGYAEVTAGLGYFVTQPGELHDDPLAAIHRQIDALNATVADLAQRLERLEEQSG
ncbi:winged helix-turn-helix domain-containing protein [Amycolatopsis sp. NPDC006131]|uniref:GntR family transcriptional regulator n=1 Tax=Amycolatopsis sp. NPDC006131 TaxID=3156731 RepID=UPI0033A1A7B3